MRIEKLYIKNFGPFKEEEFNFKTGCINLIVGKNASGKTQLASTLLYLVEGKSVLSINRGIPSEESIVEAVISQKSSKYKLSRKVCKNKFYIDYSNQVESYSKLKELRFIDIENFNPYIVFIDNMLLKEISIDIKGFDKIEELLKDNTEALVFLEYFKKKLVENTKKNRIVTSSYSEQTVYSYLSFIIKFLNCKEKQPIIFDGVSWNLSDKYKVFLLYIISELSKMNQVILIDYKDYTIDKIYKDLYIKKIKELRPGFISASRIGYKYDKKYNVFSRMDDNTNKTKVKLEYIRDTILQRDENRYIEFKEVKGNNPINSIISLIDQYVVAFLNDYKSEEGIIIWGITDQDGKVVGIELDRNQRDKIRREISEKLSKISPSIPKSSYELDLINVIDGNNNKIKDLFVLEVRVKYTKSKYLYSTASGEIYIKTDGGKKKLNMIDVQNELLYRNRLVIKEK